VGETAAAVPILMYHDVSPAPDPRFRRYTVTRRQFSRQMRWLAVLGYRAIDMDTLVRARTGGESLPARAVVITFDDGFEGCAQHAVPVLREHRFTATFYLVTGCVGGTSRWMGPEVGVELPLMGWDTVRALAAEGFRFGAHSVTHPRLAGLDPARCRAELADSRRRLEDELKRPIVHAAYPFGAYDPAARAAAATVGYASVCSTRRGLSPPDDDLLALHRVPVYGHDSLPDFASRLQSGAAVRERLARAFGRSAAAAP
jgi:peptidoglycan/xylan/chitin deacetylase (PgdA/CDA1 family)